MCCCYVLYSKVLDRYYIGYTADKLENRVRKHNQGYYGKKKYTWRSNDWELYLEIKCSNKKQAMAIERHIKKMKSRIYIENIRRYPEIIMRLKEHYSDS